MIQTILFLSVSCSAYILPYDYHRGVPGFDEYGRMVYQWPENDWQHSR